MKKYMFFWGLSLAAVVSFASNSAEEAETDEQIEMRMFGGYIRKAGSAKGKVVILNAQKRVKQDEMKAAIREIRENVRPELLWKDAATSPLPNPAEAIKAVGGNIGIVLVDDAQYPSLLTAPEEGWAIVNVAALAADKPDAAKLASRTRKEVLRAFALVGGCSFMARGSYALRPNIRKPRDLDFIKEECYGIDALGTLESSLKYYGVTPWIVTTYENACELGWAPAPTNQYQKAIWDQVHALPTKPIKILPPNKKK